MSKGTIVSVELINANELISMFGLEPNGNTQKFFSSEIVNLTDPYVPKRDGFLKNSANISLDGTYIAYSMPYAKRLWYGDNFRFRNKPTSEYDVEEGDRSPIRGSRWVIRAVADNRDELVRAVNEYISKNY